MSQPMRNHPAGMRTSAGTYSSARDRESSSVGSVGSMVSERPQRADDVFDFILLEQADGGDAGRSSFQARCGVFYGDAAESEDGDLRPAGFPQGVEAGGVGSGSVSLSEYRSENDEVDGLALGANHILVRVAGGGHEKRVSGQWPVARKFQKAAAFMRCDIIGAQMNASGSRGKRDVRAGVNEETSSKLSVLSSQWSAVAHGTQGVPCQHFQFPCAQILFAKLD